MNRVCFCTYVSDEYYHSMGADKLVRSAKYFHPEIPMFVYGTEEIEQLEVPFGLMTPFIINKLIDAYEKVICFDADSMIVGKLNELLDANDYDVIAVRNNNDFDMAGMDQPIGQPGAGTEHYLNAGLIATTSKEFVNEWVDANLMYGRLLPFMEQSVMNVLCRKYKTLMVDAKDKGVYYGVSALSGTESHWDSWKEIAVVDGELILNEKKIKVLHQAGGFKLDKLGFYMFNTETRKRLIEICGL